MDFEKERSTTLVSNETEEERKKIMKKEERLVSIMEEVDKARKYFESEVQLVRGLVRQHMLSYYDTMEALELIIDPSKTDYMAPEGTQEERQEYINLKLRKISSMVEEHSLEYFVTLQKLKQRPLNK